MDIGYSVDDWIRGARELARAMRRLPPFTSGKQVTIRPIAVIEAEIRRAVTPALRSEDV